MPPAWSRRAGRPASTQARISFSTGVPRPCNGGALRASTSAHGEAARNGYHVAARPASSEPETGGSVESAKRTARGILAIWNDCRPGTEREYEQWYRGEHLPERLSIPGFRAAWRFRAIDAEPHY